MKAFIYPYKIGSRGATALAKELETKKVFPDRKYRPRGNHVIINWGSGQIPNWHKEALDNGHSFLNNPYQVRDAANKLRAFEKMKEGDVPTPEWTRDKDEAAQWLRDGQAVVVRHKLTGHSGDGIEIVEEGAIPDAPLYTRYVKKSAEYRVHVFQGEVIDVQQKRKRAELDKDDVDFKVRNHANGWVFCREDIVEPDGLREAATKAIEALNLDFGAVDIIHNQHFNQCYVLEVNTACGLEGQTLQNYAAKIKELL